MKKTTLFLLSYLTLSLGLSANSVNIENAQQIASAIATITTIEQAILETNNTTINYQLSKAAKLISTHIHDILAAVTEKDLTTMKVIRSLQSTLTNSLDKTGLGNIRLAPDILIEIIYTIVHRFIAKNVLKSRLNRRISRVVSRVFIKTLILSTVISIINGNRYKESLKISLTEALQDGLYHLSNEVSGEIISWYIE